MSDKDPEVITLSSDEDSKLQDITQPSKRKKVDVNATTPKERALRVQSGGASKIQTVFVPKQSVKQKNGIGTIELTLNKCQNITQKNVKFNLQSSKSSINSPVPNLKNVKLSNSLCEKVTRKTKYASDLQNQSKSSLASKTSVQTCIRSTSPKNSILNKTCPVIGNLNSPNSTELKTDNSSSKTNIPLSVLSALREKGISITNVYENSKSNVAVNHKQVESQNYLRNLKHSLKRSNTNINVVPQTDDAACCIKKVIASSSILQSSVNVLKSNIKGCETVSVSKLQCEKKPISSSQNMVKKSAKDFPFKIGSEIKIIEKSSTVTNSSILNKSSNIGPNSSQKGVLCPTSSVNSQLIKKDPITDSLIHNSSKRSLLITPVTKSKNNQSESNSFAQTPKVNSMKADSSKRTRSDLTVCYTKAPSANPTVSIKSVSSTVKHNISTNISKLSSSEIPVAKRSLLQGNIRDYAKPCRTKNVDLMNDRDTLLSILSLCDSISSEQIPCNIEPKTNCSSTEVCILPLTCEPSISQSKMKPVIPLYESMKLQDVPSKTCNWPKLFVSLERLDELVKYTEKELTSLESIPEIKNLSETNDKLSGGPELVDHNERLSENTVSNHSIVVASPDSHLSTETANQTAEHCKIMKSSVDTRIPTNLSDKKTMNLNSANALSRLLDTKSSSNSNGLSQKVERELTLKDRTKICVNNVITRQNTNDISKVKSVESLCKSDTISCDMSNEDISNNSEGKKYLENMDFCSEAFDSDMHSIVKSDIFSKKNSNCSGKEQERITDKNFSAADENFIDLSESSETSLVNLLNSIIVNVENERSEEIHEETCTKILNSIITAIEKSTDSLLAEKENEAGIIKPCQESIKNAVSEDSVHLLSKNVCMDIIRKEKLIPCGTVLYSAVENENFSENQEENKKENALIYDILPSDEEKLSDYLTVSEKFLEKTSTSVAPEKSVDNVCGRTDASTNFGITTKLAVPSKETPKEIFYHTSLNSTDSELKCSETEVICKATAVKIAADGNGRCPPFDRNINEDKNDRSEKRSSAFVSNDIEIECAVLNPITNNPSPECDNDMIESSKDGVCFQEENAIISLSPLHENGGLSCVIVNVKSKCDSFIEEEQNWNFEKDSEFEQVQCVSEQENMDSNDKVLEPCLKLFPSEEDTRSSDKYARACTDDEREHIFSQIHSNQVTSPKLSLKRHASSESPDHRLRENNSIYSMKNGLKKMKLDEPKADGVHKEMISSDKSIVLFNENREENNKRKFLELLEYSKTLMDESSVDEKEKIVKNMKKKLSETQSWYPGSETFSSLIDNTSNRLKRMVHGSGENVFSILQEMRKEFKNYKCKLTVSLSKETIQDTNSACSSFSSKNEVVEGNNCSFKTYLTKETKMLSNFQDSIPEKFHNLLSTSASESVTSEGIKSFVSKDNIVESKKDMSSTTFHSVLTSKSAKNLVFVHNSVDRAIPNLKPVSSSAVESSVLKNSKANNQCDALVTPSTSRQDSSTSDAALLVVAEKNINEKIDKPDFSASSPLHSCSLNSHEPSVVEDDIIDINASLHQSTPKSKGSSQVIQNIKSSSSMSSRNLSSDRNPNVQPVRGDDINLGIVTCLSVDKINDTIAVLNQEKSFKETKSESTNERSELRIKKLEKMLERLDKKIKKLQEKDLSLDDLDDADSAYILEEKYVKKFNQVWKVLCKELKQPSRTGRIIEKKFKFEGSRFKAVNAAVEKLINKRKNEEKFPDYPEVLNLIKRVNDEEDIGLNDKHVELEAERVFRDVGKELQIRRCRDHEDLFGCHLTDSFDPSNDPAEHDEELKNVLITNKQNFEERINEVIDSFAEKQRVTPEEDGNQDNNSFDDDEDEEIDKDLPPTDPGSPLSDALDSCKKKESDDDIMEIDKESDKSTDPNDSLRTDEEDKRQESSTSGLINFQTNRSTFIDPIHIEDSDSSGDLPSIQELMSSR